MNPLLALDNVILIPHSLAWTDQLFGAIGHSVVESILAIKHGKIPDNVVNTEVMQNPLFLEKLGAPRR